MLRVLFLITFLIGTSNITFGWWDTPHMVVAEIAKRELKPETLDKAEKIIAYFNHDFPESATFVTAACFADDITKIGLSGFKVWHGLLTPYDPENLMTPREIASIQALTNANNLCTGLCQCIHTLQDPNASPWARSFMLRTLIHLVGDIHQPLHCILYYSHQFPTGDLAGHKFTLDHPVYPTLHKLWDSVFGIGPKKFPRPLSVQNEKWIQDIASHITATFPRQEVPQSTLLDPHLWGKESTQLAIDVVYDGIELGDSPSEAYWQRGQWVAKRQLALAGYRLANVLEKLLDQNE